MTDVKTRIRNANARDIQSGASNPVAVINYLHKAMDDFKRPDGIRDTEAMRNDPAMRIIVHQLAYLFGVVDIEWDDYSQISEAIKPK